MKKLKTVNQKIIWRLWQQTFASDIRKNCITCNIKFFRNANVLKFGELNESNLKNFKNKLLPRPKKKSKQKQNNVNEVFVCRKFLYEVSKLKWCIKSFGNEKKIFRKYCTVFSEMQRSAEIKINLIIAINNQKRYYLTGLWR